MKGSLRVTYKLHRECDVVIEKRQIRKGTKIKIYKSADAVVHKIMVFFKDIQVVLLFSNSV